MSDIREIRVEYGRTVNLGNHESERLQVGLEATVGQDEDSGFVTDDLVLRARGIVARWLVRFRDERRRPGFLNPVDELPLEEDEP
jgi:hypothetical protein